MKKALFLILASLTLAGCLTWSEFDSNLASFNGKPVRAAFDVLGYPDAQQQFGDETVYTWATSRSGAMLLPSTSTTNAFVGGKSVTATTTGTQAIPFEAACKLKIITGADGLVRKSEYEGNTSGCEGYMRALYKAARK